MHMSHISCKYKSTSFSIGLRHLQNVAWKENLNLCIFDLQIFMAPRVLAQDIFVVVGPFLHIQVVCICVECVVYQP